MATVLENLRPNSITHYAILAADRFEAGSNLSATSFEPASNLTALLLPKSQIPLRYLVRSWFEAGSKLVTDRFEAGSNLSATSLNQLRTR